jgi:hypothetical protein
MDLAGERYAWVQKFIEMLLEPGFRGAGSPP